VLPYLVDAATPGGEVIDTSRIAEEIAVTNPLRARSL
jgi:hypothetical protein